MSRRGASWWRGALALGLGLGLVACGSPLVRPHRQTAQRGASPLHPRAIPSAHLLPVGQTTVILSEPQPGGAARVIPTVLFYPRATKGPAAGPSPLVVFSPGYDIDPGAYSPLLRAWAGAGYVVAEPEYPHTTPGAPDGLDESDILNHPRDLAFVIATLTGPRGARPAPVRASIRADDVAVAGHSDGADVALALVAAPCCRYRPLQAALILSGAELAGFGTTYYGAGSVPLLVAQGSADVVNVPACSTQLYDAAPVPRYYLSLPGASHLGPYAGQGPLPQAVATITIRFLDAYLKGDTSALTGAPVAAGTLAVFTAQDPQPQAQGECPGAPGY